MNATSLRWLAAGLTAAVLLVAGAGVWLARPPAPDLAPAVAAKPEYLGSTACAACHAPQFDAWRSSQHALAMQPAGPATVLGNFSAAQFRHAGVTSTFFTRDGAFFVNTDGVDGKPADFGVPYVFGVAPLQQYLVPLPGGRLQALGIAWDARPQAAGGQRWFQLYPQPTLAAGDPLHWTGIDQNWNYQCADCHSTNLRKNYDATSRSFRTSWSEISVGCEACHGAGSDHVAWARAPAEQRAPDSAMGLAIRLDERQGASWTPDAARGTAVRSAARTSDREIEACAVCHSRREQFADDHPPAFLDAYRPALLEPGLYEVDGQMRDEVYNYGAFLQSRMYAQGVTCADCHEPHGGALRAPGNAVCARCHAPAKFDAAEHHRHAPGSAGAQCAACHMPQRTYMVVDARHDHSFRIPRPDRSATLGTPNACNACHRNRSPGWAAAAIRRWYPQPNPGFQTFAEAFHAADTGAVDAPAALLGVIGDAAQPPLVRASALQRLGSRVNAAALPALEAALHDASALVRSAAAQAFADAPPAERARALTPLLNDPVRLVRMDAGRALAGEAERQPGVRDAAALGRAVDEYLAAQRFNADRPGAQVNIGNVLAARGDFAGARAAFEEARALDPAFAPAAVNLADLHRAAGDEAQAEQILRAALERNGRDASLRHALGLTLVRTRRLPEALVQLAEAARLDPGNPRHAYVWAVALHDGGRAADAIRILEAAQALHPADRDILAALVSYETLAGRIERAREYAAMLQALDKP